MPSLVLLLGAGCDVGINGDLTGFRGDGRDLSIPEGSDLSVSQSGLPCDVARILSTNCLSCHGPTPAVGVPQSLVSYEQLAATSPIGGPYAERSLSRMKEPIARMPPPPAAAVPAEDIALFEAWVKGGLARGSCEGSPPDLGGLDLSVAPGDMATPPQTQTGLPCEIASVLAVCVTCHGNPPSNNAPSTLLTIADLRAVAGGATGAERALARMQDPQAPMPPAPNAPMTAMQIATFQSWVQQGMPEGKCDMTFDGGVVEDPFNTPDVCTSGITWAGGEQDWGKYPKTAMHPGMPCIDCHDNPRKFGKPDRGPQLYFGGTVYPSGHEFDECFGVNGNRGAVSVEIVDSNKRVYTLTAEVSGNFYLRPGINVTAPVFPVTASVKANGKVRAMVGSVPTGDCNSCHTLRGSQMAPGRIMLP